MEKPRFYFTWLLPSTYYHHSGLSFWRRPRQPLLTQEPECFLGRSPPQRPPTLAAGIRAGPHFDGHRERLVPPALASPSFTFSAPSSRVSAFLFSFFLVAVIKYADKSNVGEESLFQLKSQGYRPSGWEAREADGKSLRRVGGA